MPALLMALALLASPAPPSAVPLALGERQVVTLEFTRPVARLGVTDADALLLEAQGTRRLPRAARAVRLRLRLSGRLPGRGGAPPVGGASVAAS